jgi:hypothetical protein
MLTIAAHLYSDSGRLFSRRTIVISSMKSAHSLCVVGARASSLFRLRRIWPRPIRDAVQFSPTVNSTPIVIPSAVMTTPGEYVPPSDETSEGVMITPQQEQVRQTSDTTRDGTTFNME